MKYRAIVAACLISFSSAYAEERLSLVAYRPPDASLNDVPYLLNFSVETDAFTETQTISNTSLTKISNSLLLLRSDDLRTVNQELATVQTLIPAAQIQDTIFKAQQNDVYRSDDTKCYVVDTNAIREHTIADSALINTITLGSSVPVYNSDVYVSNESGYALYQERTSLTSTDYNVSIIKLSDSTRTQLTTTPIASTSHFFGSYDPSSGSFSYGVLADGKKSKILMYNPATTAKTEISLDFDIDQYQTLAFSDDGDTIYIGTDQGQFYAWSRSKAKKLLLASHPEYNDGFARMVVTDDGKAFDAGLCSQFSNFARDAVKLLKNTNDGIEYAKSNKCTASVGVDARTLKSITSLYKSLKKKAPTTLDGYTVGGYLEILDQVDTTAKAINKCLKKGKHTPFKFKKATALATLLDKGNFPVFQCSLSK